MGIIFNFQVFGGIIHTRDMHLPWIIIHLKRTIKTQDGVFRTKILLFKTIIHRTINHARHTMTPITVFLRGYNVTKNLSNLTVIRGFCSWNYGI